MGTAERMRIKVFADGADLAGMLALAAHPLIKGFTTNPTLMRQAGVVGYESFARQVLAQITDRPVSFEVFSDEFEEMERQALRIAGWGSNVNVKIPVTNTLGHSSAKLVRRLAEDGVQLNVTALMSLPQVRTIAEALEGGPPAIVSVFAGRIADTGRDPVPLMAAALELVRPYPNIELLWASPRELLNVVQADAIGCHIITVTHDLLKKLPSLDKDLDEFSLDTVKMFHRDAEAAGYRL
jgi:transaldolase